MMVEGWPDSGYETESKTAEELDLESVIDTWRLQCRRSCKYIL